jgi:hypothetical protein
MKMWLFFIMFRLHIVFQGVSFCGSTMSLTIVENLPGEKEMKKLVLIGLVIVSTAAGCGRGWLPFRGAPCNSNCVHATPAYDGCQDCTSGHAGYEGYEGGQYGGGIVSEQPYYGGPAVPGTNIAPPMTGLPRAGG